MVVAKQSRKVPAFVIYAAPLIAFGLMWASFFLNRSNSQSFSGGSLLSGVPSALNAVSLAKTLEEHKCCDYRRSSCHYDNECFSLLCDYLAPVKVSPEKMMKFRGFKIQKISARHPTAIVVPDFLDARQCKHFIKEGERRLQPSVTFVDEEAGVMDVTSERSSFDATLPVDDPVLKQLHAQLSRLIGRPREHFENIVILRYRMGERYLPHMDAFGPANDFQEGEQRIQTMVVFLNDVDYGGDFVFMRAGIRVRPKQGMALLFDSVILDENGQPSLDPFSTHGGCPPASNDQDKWLATIWIHNGPVSWRSDRKDPPAQQETDDIPALASSEEEDD